MTLQGKQHKCIMGKMRDKTDYLLEIERSPIKDTEIKQLLKQSLTDKIDDRKVYMKGIDNSYLYEGYLSFKTEELQIVKNGKEENYEDTY